MSLMTKFNGHEGPLDICSSTRLRQYPVSAFFRIGILAAHALALAGLLVAPQAQAVPIGNSQGTVEIPDGEISMADDVGGIPAGTGGRGSNVTLPGFFQCDRTAGLHWWRALAGARQPSGGRSFTTPSSASSARPTVTSLPSWKRLLHRDTEVGTRCNAWSVSFS